MDSGAEPPIVVERRPRQSALAQLGTFFDSLAGRLLALIVGAVIAIEAGAFTPAIVNFHQSWLHDRINIAQVAALALEAAPEQSEIGQQLEYELLTNAEVLRVVLERDGERQLILEGPADIPPARVATYDYTQADGLKPALWAAQTYFAPEGRVLRVLARPRFESGEQIEIVLNEAPLKRAMTAFAQTFLVASMLILLMAGAIVYTALSLMFVRPMWALTRSIERFRDNPEDVSVFKRSRRSDEIGRAQRAAADMAEQVRASLRQKERLAALGAAVARIGHDLRNMLATAQMVADRMTKSEDPAVRQIAPRLERAIDRAAQLASSTLKYGRADERAPELKRVVLADAVEEAGLDALIGFDAVLFHHDIELDLAVLADEEHLHRILVNLMRNAAQAMTAHTRADKTLTMRALALDGRVEIDVIDKGPGVREDMLEKIFDPFVSADSERGGTGLGLAIARELARAMGGELALTRTGAEGATFTLTLKAGVYW